MSFRTASGENYFSLDDILSTNERVPCRLELPLYKLGFLDSSGESPHLLPGYKLDLPFWLAHDLQSRHIVSVELPKVYRESYREILKADANAVDLHKMGPYFYSFGQHLMSLPFIDKLDISKTLSQTFRTRFRKILDSSQNSVSEDTAGIKASLDRSEVELFDIGQKTTTQFHHWQVRWMERISAADMVVNRRRRKRASLDI